VAVVVPRDDAPDERLLGLTQSAHWLARETRARVGVVLPETAAGRAVLDSILYDAPRIPAATKPGASADLGLRPGTASLPRGDGGPAAAAQRHLHLDEERFRVLPVIGHPHPFSPGEQALAAAIRADAELGPLFGFNLPVETIRGSRFLVDLLWPTGRVVVEVDSRRFHAGPEPFAADRRRDYELLVSGYRTLRLTHDEALVETAGALEKIREVARLPAWAARPPD
jgi:very-short-patch-repair endonuclease